MDLEADALALGVDRGAGDPAAAAEQVEDDLAGLARGLQPRRDEGRRGRRREALERGEAEPRVSSQEQRTARHRARLSQTVGSRAPRRTRESKTGRTRRPVPIDRVRVYGSSSSSGLLDERLVGRLLGRQDAVEVLDLLVLDVVLEIVLEVLSSRTSVPLVYGPQVRRLGGGRERDLAVVARVLEDLADDEPDVLVAEEVTPAGTCCRRP